LTYTAQVTAASGVTISVTPSTFTVRPGRSARLKITVGRTATTTPPRLLSGEIQAGAGTAQTTMTSGQFRGTAIDLDTVTVQPGT
jgi:hypothetical protein